MKFQPQLYDMRNYCQFLVIMSLFIQTVCTDLRKFIIMMCFVISTVSNDLSLIEFNVGASPIVVRSREWSADR